ncbi:response regulator transcription factor [Rhizobium sp. KVB221]|uniref:Response regulator transcription factor n=1 Tax=Rhizobium setariae TaxID=2801340 RepID=A0A937CNH9_9HYPH|nr:LuxR C-terminal-related transcriptional regulator [Rhizobium setariae]MBL0373761.1 response regulator transcription factor [Rhizobium setariae]
MRVDFEGLFHAAAKLVGQEQPTDEAFGQSCVEMLRSLVDFDYSVTFAYRGDERPIDLYSTFNEQDYHVFVRLYQQGAYLLDPFHSAATLPKPGIWRMRELAPDRFFASEYYRGYYGQTGLSEELGYFVPVGEGITVVFSLMRSEKAGAFKSAEYELLCKASAFVHALIRSQWQDLSRRFDARISRKRGRSQASAARPWDDGRLTLREQAIIELVLQGHSSESIGLRLGVTTGTVKVHRRNIYRKLGISSQTQLMSLYLDNLNRRKST